MKQSASVWLSFSYSVRYYTDGTGHYPSWLLLESLWQMLVGYLQDGILSISFFSFTFCAFLPCSNVFFWQSMPNIINNIVCVMPKLLLWLSVSSFGVSYVYTVALLGKPHCQEEDCVSLLPHRTTYFFRKGLRGISKTQQCKDVCYVKRVPWNSSRTGVQLCEL